MNTNLEEIIFNIIGYAGTARSMCFEALALAKDGKIAEADALIVEAKEELLKVHGMQTALIQSEAAGEKNEVSLLLVHAQDHLMTAMLAKDLIVELIDMHRKNYNSKEVGANVQERA